ncbi:uncharacterized protein LOC127240180 [Andrographis paniculata]|uniref:uncharacterized protein LOC127240180 n=1 Tax=Andrographis paniculata TaxID=175694 RepID=UPI0021E6E708|nr:uncharacterized protein LOC127240180 [Andrographis paniculata]
MSIITTSVHSPFLSLGPTNAIRVYKKLLPSDGFVCGRLSSFQCCCRGKDDDPATHQGFSILKTNAQVDIGNVWSSVGFYVFGIHVPLSFGGLSAAAKLLQQPLLNPQIAAFLLLGIQTLELGIVLLLLKRPGKPQYDLADFFHGSKSSKGRSILLGVALGFGFLSSLVFITSYFAEILIGSKDANDPFVKDVLCSSSSSIVCSVLVYSIVTPLLEEVVYRGFLLTSLAASDMEWRQAVALSSLAFSAAHFSGENFLQLFIVGIVLGSSYCWTGNLAAPLAIHSLYNSLIMLSVFIS